MLVTYDENGGYGHPDHIQAHRVAMRAVELAADPDVPAAGEPWRIAKVYWTAIPRVVRCATGLRRLRDAGDTDFFDGMDPDGELPTSSIPTTW